MEAQEEMKKVMSLLGKFMDDVFLLRAVRCLEKSSFPSHLLAVISLASAAVESSAAITHFMPSLSVESPENRFRFVGQQLRWLVKPHECERAVFAYNANKSNTLTEFLLGNPFS